MKFPLLVGRLAIFGGLAGVGAELAEGHPYLAGGVLVFGAVGAWKVSEWITEKMGQTGDETDGTGQQGPTPVE